MKKVPSRGKGATGAIHILIASSLINRPIRLQMNGKRRILDEDVGKSASSLVSTSIQNTPACGVASNIISGMSLVKSHRSMTGLEDYKSKHTSLLLLYLYPLAYFSDRNDEPAVPAYIIWRRTGRKGLI